MQTLTNIFNLVFDFIHIQTHCMGAEKALDSVHPCRHRQTSTIWSKTLSTYILTVWEQRRLWTECIHADIDKNLQFDLRHYIHPHLLYGSREGFGQCAPMQTLKNIYNLVLDIIYIHTHCMGAGKALERLHPCRHRQTSTIRSETLSTSLPTVWEQRRLWTVRTHAAIDKHLQFGLRHYLHPYYLYGSREGFGQSATMRA